MNELQILNKQQILGKELGLNKQQIVNKQQKQSALVYMLKTTCSTINNKHLSE